MITGCLTIIKHKPVWLEYNLRWHLSFRCPVYSASQRKVWYSEYSWATVDCRCYKPALLIWIHAGIMSVAPAASSITKVIKPFHPTSPLLTTSGLWPVGPKCTCPAKSKCFWADRLPSTAVRTQALGCYVGVGCTQTRTWMSERHTDESQIWERAEGGEDNGE